MDSAPNFSPKSVNGIVIAACYIDAHGPDRRGR
jgi:hypothetical protein